MHVYLQLIIAFMKALKLHNLTSSLDLSYNSLSDEGAVVVANLLKDDTSLVEINLTFNDITAQGAEALFLALRVWIISLRSNVCVWSIAWTLRGNPPLHSH